MVAHDTLRVTQPEYDTQVTVTSMLTIVGTAMLQMSGLTGRRVIMSNLSFCIGENVWEAVPKKPARAKLQQARGTRNAGPAF